MRLFGSNRIARVMDAMGHKEGDVIQHSMVSKSIERAQKKVEENNFGIRKRLLEYDDVMNAQREVIYKRRRHALFGERIDVDISNMFMDVCEAIVSEFHGTYSFEDFKLEIIRQFSLDVPITEEEYLDLKSSEIAERLYKVAIESYDRKAQDIARQAYPVIKEVYEKQSAVYENIVVPISDGQKTYQIVANLKKAYESGGKELIKAFTKNVILFTIDEYWKEHLREMDELKQSVQNAVYEQKDPLLIYKLEAFNLFRDMIDKLNREIVSILVKAFIPLRDPNQVQEARQRRRTDMSKYQTSRNDALQAAANTQEKTQQPVKVEVKVGRNDPCPCGSGKKYKHCHGKNQ
jgi:preprotein translocase subunit SecA